MAKKRNDVTVESPFLNVAEAAQYMKIAKKTVYNLIYKKDTLKFPVRHFGRKPIFLIDELRKWMEETT